MSEENLKQIKISIQKIPTGLKIISSELGPAEASAAKITSGLKLIARSVSIKVLNLFKNFIMPLFFHCFKQHKYIFLRKNDK